MIEPRYSVCHHPRIPRNTHLQLLQYRYSYTGNSDGAAGPVLPYAAPVAQVQAFKR